MKKEGSLKLILSLLIIVLLIAVSLGGIYVKDKNVMKNIIPDYNLGMELDTNTIIKLDVVKPAEDSSEETKEEEKETNSEGVIEENNTSENSDSAQEKQDGQAEEKQEKIYTAENYKKTKSIIEKRFKSFGIEQYTIRLDENTGTIVIEVPSNVNTNSLSNVFAVGNTEIKISETSEVIGDFNSIKKINLTNESGALRADITLSKDAQDKYKEMKNTYQIPADEDGVLKDNTIIMSIDGSEVFSWKENEFLKQAANGTVLINYFNLEYKKEIEEEINSLNAFIEFGKLPVEYKINYSNDIHSSINSFGIVSVVGIILLVMFVILTLKYKVKGIISWASILGYLSLLLLLIRYVKIEISIAAIVAIAVVTILEFIYMLKLLANKKISSKIFNDETIEFSKMIIPAFIMSIAIAFGKIIEISSFGMVIFWGIVIFELFNNIITRACLTNVKNK